jgi:hypothetical protein
MHMSFFMLRFKKKSYRFLKISKIDFDGFQKSTKNRRKHKNKSCQISYLITVELSFKLNMSKKLFRIFNFRAEYLRNEIFYSITSMGFFDPHD